MSYIVKLLFSIFLHIHSKMSKWLCVFTVISKWNLKLVFFVYHNVNTILYVAAELHNNPQNCFSFLCSLIEKNPTDFEFWYARLCKNLHVCNLLHYIKVLVQHGYKGRFHNWYDSLCIFSKPWIISQKIIFTYILRPWYHIIL